MSWSGPVAGAPPFQQPPYGNGHPGYGQQPPYQYGQQPQQPQQPSYGQYPPASAPAWPAPGPPQRAPDNRPPKKKGNPIITRYPPPPGYRGPAQPQGPFGTNQYQPPQPAYPQGSSVPPTYPAQGYTAPAPNQGYPPPGYGPPQPSHYSQPTYPPQPTYPQVQHQKWPQSGYLPNPGYPHTPSQPATHGYAPPQSGYQGYAPLTAPADPNRQVYSQALGWPSHNGQAPFAPQNHHVPHNGLPLSTSSMIDPNATPTPATVHLNTSQPPMLSQPPSAVSERNSSDRPQLFLGWDDWDFDFDGAIWPKSNEPIDPNLSLGVIIWHPAKQMTRALPSTFAEAEEQSSQPAPEGLDNGESVSMYFTAENSHEAFLNVRQTDEWENIRDDPVFVVFMDDEMKHNLIPLEDCVAQRDRSDEASDDLSQDEDQEMCDATWDIMENLEQALSSTNGYSKSEQRKREEPAPAYTTQEDILAKLGVTGAPKPPSDERMSPSLPMQDVKSTATLPEKPFIAPHSKHPGAPSTLPRSQSYNGLQTSGHGPTYQRPYGATLSSAIARPPPPPPPPEQPRYDPWNAPQSSNHGFDGSRGSPALSEGSNRTMVGSDFGSEKPGGSNEPESSTVPSLQRSDSSFSRKRSYEDADQGGKLRQQDDYSKRKRRSQVDAAYSRR